MEAAEKAGDNAGQAAAALEALGTLFGGGHRVNPLDVEQMKPFVPATLAGLPRTRINVGTNGIGGIMATQAEATFRSGDKEISLSIVDSGGVSGLVAFATWTDMREDNEDEFGSERTHKVDGRIVHEKVSKNGGSNEYGVVLGERFAVKVESRDFDLSALKAAAASLDLAKLESLKNLGVQK
jgi:hypothetical protein